MYATLPSHTWAIHVDIHDTCMLNICNMYVSYKVNACGHICDMYAACMQHVRCHTWAIHVGIHDTCMLTGVDLSGRTHSRPE